VLDVQVTRAGYTPYAQVSQRFFATVQQTMHAAAHGQTASEVIHARLEASGVRSWG
jgi:hypothetical protein